MPKLSHVGEPPDRSRGFQKASGRVPAQKITAVPSVVRQGWAEGAAGSTEIWDWHELSLPVVVLPASLPQHSPASQLSLARSGAGECVNSVVLPQSFWMKVGCAIRCDGSESWLTAAMLSPQRACTGADGHCHCKVSKGCSCKA